MPAQRRTQGSDRTQGGIPAAPEQQQQQQCCHCCCSRHQHAQQSQPACCSAPQVNQQVNRHSYKGQPPMGQQLRQPAPAAAAVPPTAGTAAPAPAAASAAEASARPGQEHHHLQGRLPCVQVCQQRTPRLCCALPGSSSSSHSSNGARCCPSPCTLCTPDAPPTAELQPHQQQQHTRSPQQYRRWTVRFCGMLQAPWTHQHAHRRSARRRIHYLPW